MCLRLARCCTRTGCSDELLISIELVLQARSPIDRMKTSSSLFVLLEIRLV